MESVGDEKRIQALFSEQAFEDQSLAPRFEKLWRTESNARRPVLVTMRPVAVMIVVAVLAGVSLLAASSWYRSSQYQQVANLPPQTIAITSVTPTKDPDNLLSADPKTLHKERRRRLVRQRQIERIATQESAMLSNWQSPTSIFLEAPTAMALSSLPQLNQSARDLETFLTNNEMTKESKQ